MRGYVEQTFGRFFPLTQFEDMARQNMALFQRAASMFRPPCRDEEANPTGPRSGGADRPAAQKPGLEHEMRELQHRMESLQRQLDSLQKTRQRPSPPPRPQASATPPAPSAECRPVADLAAPVALQAHQGLVGLPQLLLADEPAGQLLGCCAGRGR